MHSGVINQIREIAQNVGYDLSLGQWTQTIVDEYSWLITRQENLLEGDGWLKVSGQIISVDWAHKTLTKWL